MKNVLLVEDQLGDARLTQEAFHCTAAFIRLHIAADGIEALALMKPSGNPVSVVRPDLILLDLNLPKMDGRALLAELKQDRELAGIPVVVLTASATPGDVENCYKSGASCFLEKPVAMARRLPVTVAVATG
jgi:chemotaxis family two-component system response regulator Rcp1